MTPSPSESDFYGLLTAKGVRVTEQRLALLQALSLAASPVTFTELADRCGIGRATVYRNLLLLAEAGVLIRARLGDNVVRFNLPRTLDDDHSRHPHLVCGGCGVVRCLPTSAVRLYGEAAESDVAEVQLRGRCAQCVSLA